MTQIEVEPKIDGRGRPQSPKTQELIAILTARVKELEQGQDEFKQMEQMAEIIRILMRAMKGLEADDDIFYGLIDPKKIEERTRLEDSEAISHSAMRSAAQQWPLFTILDTLADREDHYFISGDNETGGLGRREAILMRQAQAKTEGNMILNMPNPSGGVAQTDQPEATQTQPKKKGLLARVLHR